MAEIKIVPERPQQPEIPEIKPAQPETPVRPETPEVTPQTTPPPPAQPNETPQIKGLGITFITMPVYGWPANVENYWQSPTMIWNL